MSFRICSYRHLNKCELLNIANRRTLYGVCDIVHRNADILRPQFRIPYAHPLPDPIQTKVIYEVYETVYMIQHEHYKWFHLYYNNQQDNNVFYLPTCVNKGDMIVFDDTLM